MKEAEYLIVGAGVSGLAFCDRLKSDDYLICEASNQIGGYCKTIYQDGFTWDYSGHFFHFKQPEIERLLIDRMESEEIITATKESKIYWGERWIDFPFQKNIHQLPQSDFVDCIHSLYFREQIAPSNFEEMLRANFGRGISQRFLVPYNRKLYATDLKNLDMNAMGRFFPYANIDQIISNFKTQENSSYNNTFTYPKKGAIQYVNALAKEIDFDKICTGEKVLEINLKDKIAKTNLRAIRYKNLISSAPLTYLASASKLAFKESAFSWNKVLVFNMGFNNKGLDKIHWAYFPQEDIIFYRVGFYDNIVESDRMSLYVEIGLDFDEEVDESRIIFYKNQVLSDLIKTGIVSNHEIVSWHWVVMDPAYVHITSESIREVARIKRILVNHGVHSIGRYGGWTYCSIEDNIIEARELADTFNAVIENYE